MSNYRSTCLDGSLSTPGEWNRREETESKVASISRGWTSEARCHNFPSVGEIDRGFLDGTDQKGRKTVQRILLGAGRAAFPSGNAFQLPSWQDASLIPKFPLISRHRVIPRTTEHARFSRTIRRRRVYGAWLCGNRTNTRVRINIEKWLGKSND